MKVYVTGAGGMIGSHLIEILHQKGYEVVGSYFHPTVDLNEIDQTGIRLFELDLRNHATVLSWILDYLPDRIYHLAAQSFPVVSWKDPYYTMDVNVSGTVGLFEAIKEAKQLHPDYDPRVVVISSSAIYGQALQSYSIDHLPKEDCPMLPVSPYGVSKAAEDLLCYQYFDNFKIKVCRVRLFNCTGTRKIGDITADFTRRAVELEKKGSRQLVVGNLTSTRAIIDARDVAEGLILLGEKGVPGEPYNICSSHVFQMDYVIKCIENVTGVHYDLVTDPKLLRPADEKLYIGDSSKIKALGWSEKYNYEDTVRAMIEYWRKKIFEFCSKI